MKTKIFAYITFMLFVIPNMLTAQTTVQQGNLITTGWLKTDDGRLLLRDQTLYGNNAGYFLFYSNDATRSGIGLYGKNNKNYGFFRSGNNGGNIGITDSLDNWIMRSSMDNFIEFRVANDEKMRINNNGSVLIGTQSNPNNYKLNVAGKILAQEIKLGDNTHKGSLKYEYHDHEGIPDSSYWHLTMRASPDPLANSFYLAENGLALIGINDPCLKAFTPNTYLYVGGEAQKSDGNGFWTYASDERLKTDIEPLDESLEKLMDVNFYSYKYLDTDEFRYGVLAQEMQAIMPRSVGTYTDNTDGTEYLNFNPNDLFFTGLKATQEVGEELAEQKEIINTLIEENAELRNELDEIKAALAEYGIELQNIDTGDSGLEQNQPNPFSSSTAISYHLPKSGGHAVISIHDMTGRIFQKKILPNTAGQGQIEVNLNDLDANGTYFYSLHIGNELIDTKQMIFVK